MSFNCGVYVFHLLDSNSSDYVVHVELITTFRNVLIPFVAFVLSI